VALGGEEGEAHAPTDQQDVNFGEQGLDHPDLVGDLGPPEDGHKRPLRLSEQAVQDRNLAGQDAAGGRGQEGGWTDDGGVRPVSGAERVVYVQVLVFDQRSDEGGVVAFLAGVVPQVFQELDPAGVGALGLEQFVQALAHGRDRVLGIGLTLGPAQWLHTVSFAAPWSSNQVRVSMGAGCAGRR